MSDVSADEFPLPAADIEPLPAIDAAAMAAREMIHGALKASGIWAAAKAPGAFAILIAPSPEWSEILLAEWQRAVLERADASMPRTRWGRATDLHILVPDGERLKSRRRDDENSLSEALSGGFGALLVTHDIGLLTPTERAAADLVVEIPQLTPAQLASVAAAFGSGPVPHFDDALPVAATPAAMRLSYRPHGLAADFIARLSRFVAAAEAEKPTMITPPVVQGLEGLHGMDEAVAWGFALAKDLKAFVRGDIEWSEVSSGCLLSGPPGVGKSTYAYRLASECKVPIVITSYSEWQSAGREGHLGELLKCMRSKFAEARKMAPSILFIDELDSVQSRTTGISDNTNAWFTSIINALLFEFGNPQSLTGVVVIGASNHASRVDPALRRAGRLGTEIRISLPDVGALEAILRSYLESDLVDADLSPVAQRLLGGSGADVEKAVRDARRRARHAGRTIEISDFLATDGEEHGRRPSRRTALHEAGHAVVVASTRPHDIVSLCVQKGGKNLGGLTFHFAAGGGSTDADMARTLRELLAGRAAEEVFFGHPSGGSGGSADSDLARATCIAVSCEITWGLGKSLIWFGDFSPTECGRMLSVHPGLASRVEARLSFAYAETLTIIRERRAAVEALADALLARDFMTGDEVREVLDQVPAPPKIQRLKPTRSEFREAEFESASPIQDIR